MQRLVIVNEGPANSGLSACGSPSGARAGSGGAMVAARVPDRSSEPTRDKALPVWCRRHGHPRQWRPLQDTSVDYRRVHVRPITTGETERLLRFEFVDDKKSDKKPGASARRARCASRVP
jgi:hypothetical protein